MARGLAAHVRAAADRLAADARRLMAAGIEVVVAPMALIHGTGLMLAKWPESIN